jgi:hypothetical protein
LNFFNGGGMQVIATTTMGMHIYESRHDNRIRGVDAESVRQRRLAAILYTASLTNRRDEGIFYGYVAHRDVSHPIYQAGTE